MATVRARSPFRWFRRLLLLLGILCLGGITVLLLAYRFGQEASPESAEETVDGNGGGDGAVSAAEGFDYTLWSDQRRIFRIRAARSRQERDNTAFMEDVTLDIYRQSEEETEDGEALSEDSYTVTSQRARVNQNTWAARLEGDVVVSGWEDVELEARVLELRDGGQVLESVGAVSFRYPPNLVGRATEMRLDRRTGTIRLEGGVHVKSDEGAEVPMRLDSQRLTYRRDEGLLRALDDVSFRFGTRQLQTRSLTVFLDEERSGLKHLVARWDVLASLAPEDPVEGGASLQLQGEHLEMVPDETRPEVRRIQLRGAERGAVVKAVESDGLARRISGQVLEGLVIDGVLQLVEGYGEPLTLTEYLDTPEAPFRLRQACARSAVARFLPDGELAQIQLEQQVELSDEETYLSGGRRAHLDLASGKLDIEGKAVELLSERGDLTAPRFDYRKETGFIRAKGGVRGTLTSGSAATLAASPLSQGDGPLRVEAEEAFFTGDPRTFSFRGQVRAWRADNLLIADQLRGDEETEQLAASGGVKTVWIPTTTRGGATASGESIEVTADGLTWDRGQGRVVYDGEVQIRQEQRILRCGSMTVELTTPSETQGAEAKRMICRDEVQLVDPVGGQRVEGDLAVYSLVEEKVEVFGDSVKLLSDQNNSLTGRYLVYNLVDGKMQLRRRPPGEDRLRGGNNGIGEDR